MLFNTHINVAIGIATCVLLKKWYQGVTAFVLIAAFFSMLGEIPTVKPVMEPIYDLAFQVIIVFFLAIITNIVRSIIFIRKPGYVTHFWAIFTNSEKVQMFKTDKMGYFPYICSAIPQN